MKFRVINKNTIKFFSLFLILQLVFSCSIEDKGVKAENIIQKGELLYYRGEDIPFTGKFYGKSGDGKFEGYIKNGKQEGKFTIWFENGQKQVVSHYKDGKLHGKYTAWYSNGKVKIKCYYKNGVKIDSQN